MDAELVIVACAGLKVSVDRPRREMGVAVN